MRWLVVLMFFFSGVCLADSTGDQIRRYGYECGVRQMAFILAIEGHTSGATQEQTYQEVMRTVGRPLVNPDGPKLMKKIISVTYAKIPRGNGFRMMDGYNQLCMENPDQYIGDNFVVDLKKVN